MFRQADQCTFSPSTGAFASSRHIGLWSNFLDLRQRYPRHGGCLSAAQRGDFPIVTLTHHATWPRFAAGLSLCSPAPDSASSPSRYAPSRWQRNMFKLNVGGQPEHYARATDLSIFDTKK